MMRNFQNECKVTSVNAAAASAGTAIATTQVDMSGWHGVAFFGTMATVNAGNSVNAAQCDTSGGTYADLEGSKIVPTDDGDMFLLEVVLPKERYVRAELVRSGANTAIGEIFAVQFGRSGVNPTAPTAQVATVDEELHVSPAEGTA